MAMRHADPRPLAAPAAPIAAGRVGGCPGLVDEHQPVGIEVELILEQLSLGKDVGAVLLGGVRCLACQIMTRKSLATRLAPS